MKSLDRLLSKAFIPGFICVVILILLGGYWPRFHGTGGITIGRRHFLKVQLADTPAERAQGLSGQERLGDNEAMLFVFESPNTGCFWMKDMRFDLDILWFDANKQLVWQKLGATPESYPESFCPDEPAQYVVEIVAGTVEASDIRLGDRLITP